MIPAVTPSDARFMLKRDAVVMANARRMVPKFRNVPTNAQLYALLFGGDLAVAADRCKRIGLEPEGKTTSYNVMIEFIDSEPLQ